MGKGEKALRCIALAIMLLAAPAAAAEDVDYQTLYKKAAVDLAQSEAMVGMLKKQTLAFRWLMQLHAIDISEEIVIKADDGMIVERIDLTEDPIPAIAPRLAEKPLTN